MKKIMTVTGVEGKGLTALLGENVILFCMNYFYAGKLVGGRYRSRSRSGSRTAEGVI